jgi:endonuclease I
VFEPIDEYKGDLARTYFYVSVAYMGASWSSNQMVSGAKLNADAEAMLRAWHAADPVSSKETARNAAVEDVQGNRNPFIDHPEWVELITDF